MTARICALPGCDNPLQRKVGETTPRFAARQFCSRACAAAGRSVNAPSNTDECVAETLAACTGVCGDLIHRAMKVGKCVAGHRRHLSGFGWSVTQVCARLGLDRDVVARALAKLPSSRTVEFRAAWERDVTNKAAA